MSAALLYRQPRDTPVTKLPGSLSCDSCARRCGNLDSALLARVQALPFELLATLSEDLLDFNSPADLENWLNQKVV